MKLCKEDEKTLENYAIALVKLYCERHRVDFPVNMEEESGWIGVLGLPKMPYALKFSSKDELYGRILTLGHLLGVDRFKGKGEDLAIEVVL